LKSQPPLQLMSDLGDDGVYVWVCSHTTIWLPWQPTSATPPGRPGGRMRLDRTDTSRDYLPFVDDNGVRLDIPDGAAGRLVG